MINEKNIPDSYEIKKNYEFYNNEAFEIKLSHATKILCTKTKQKHSGKPKHCLMVTLTFKYHRKILYCSPTWPQDHTSPYIACKRNVIFFQESFWVVTKMDEESLGDSSQLYKLVPFKNFKKMQPINEMLMVYDVETCRFIYNPENEIGALHQPYLMHLAINYDIYNEHVTFIHKDIQTQYSSIGDQFATWLSSFITLHVPYDAQDGSVWYNVPVMRLVGFNNHNFDNNFILDSLRKKLPRTTLDYGSRNGKVSEIELMIFGKYKLIISDLIKFIPDMSLDSVSLYFERIFNARQVSWVDMSKDMNGRHIPKHPSSYPSASHLVKFFFLGLLRLCYRITQNECRHFGIQ